MDLRENSRAPILAGLNTEGESIIVDYSENLINLVLFFDPVSKASLDAVEFTRLLSRRYNGLSVGFWYVMVPRLSCMYKAAAAHRALDRLGLFGGVLFDVNNMISLRAGRQTLPALLVVESNGNLKALYEGEISFREAERSLQARLSLSGYRDELPQMMAIDSDYAVLRSNSVVRQLGYATDDYTLGSLLVPESAQQFALPDFCLLDTIYPYGSWYVSRDFIEGKEGGTFYASCGREESLHIFAGADREATLRIHTSIESPRNLVLGKDVREENGLLSLCVDECRPYEVLAASGDSDVLISLQIASGSVRLFAVEFCQRSPVVPATR